MSNEDETNYIIQRLKNQYGDNISILKNAEYERKTDNCIKSINFIIIYSI